MTSEIDKAIPPGTYQVRLVGPCRSGLYVDSGSCVRNYRRIQEMAVQKLSKLLASKFSIKIPESVFSNPNSSRTDNHGYQEWRPNQGGFQKVPFAFLRFIPIKETIRLDTPNDWAEIEITERHYTQFDRAILTCCLCLKITIREKVGVIKFRNLVESIAGNEAKNAIYEEASELLSLLRMNLNSIKKIAPINLINHEAILLGFHRIYEFYNSQNIEMAFELGYHCLIHHDYKNFCDQCFNPDCSVFISDGNSLLVSKSQYENDLFSPKYIIEYYQYYYSALMRIDDDLFFKIEDIESHSRGKVSLRELQKTRIEIQNKRDTARYFFYTVNDIVNSLRPIDLAYWKAMVNTWRTDDIESDIESKASHLNQIIAEIGSQINDRNSRRTNLIILGLTCLTLISIVADVLSFTTIGRELTLSIQRATIMSGALLFATIVFIVGKR